MQLEVLLTGRKYWAASAVATWPGVPAKVLHPGSTEVQTSCLHHLLPPLWLLLPPWTRMHAASAFVSSISSVRRAGFEAENLGENMGCGCGECAAGARAEGRHGA